MKLYKSLLFASLGCLLILILFWFFSFAKPVTVGTIHTELSSMSSGGDGNWIINRMSFSLLFGLLSFIALLFCLFIGVRNRINRRSTYILITACIPFLVTLSLIFYTYQDYIQSDELVLYNGFPLPTILLIYGIWFYPIVFTLLYVINFKKWVISSEEIERFKRTLSSE